MSMVVLNFVQSIQTKLHLSIERCPLQLLAAIVDRWFFLSDLRAIFTLCHIC